MANLSLILEQEVIHFPVKENEIFIGRSEDSGIRLESSRVSRRHARIYKVNDAYWIEDLNSSNGTLLNEKLIQAPVQLQEDDLLNVGGLQLRFNMSEKEPARHKGKEQDTSATQIISLTLNEVESGIGRNPEEKLRAIFNLSKRLAENNKLGNLPIIIMESVFEILPQAGIGAIALHRDNDNNYDIQVARDKHGKAVDVSRVSTTILDRVIADKVGILAEDASRDSRFDASHSIVSHGIRSIVCAPLVDLEGKTLGALYLDSDSPDVRFCAEDLDLLSTVAGQAALSYQSASLMKEQMEKEKQEQDLELARRIQRALLPSSLPEVEGYAFFAGYEPAHAVGGDYYDCFPTGDGGVCVALGDVAGKGVSASLLMSRLSSVIQSSMRFVRDPLAAFSYVNKHMCRGSVEGRFVTLIIAIIYPREHKVHLINGGHLPPIVRRADGSLICLDEEKVGVPLGIVDDYIFELETLELDVGDSVVFYSDGITEARNENGKLYGDDRLQRVVSTFSLDAGAMGEAILDDVRRYIGREGQSDDLSLVCFGRKPQ